MAVFKTFGFGGDILTPDPLVPLWRVTAGGNVYSFEADTVTIQSQTANGITLVGTGYAYLNGVDKTPGLWSITDTGFYSSFTFGAATIIPGVPDGGLTVGMLGMVFGGCAMVARKMKILA